MYLKSIEIHGFKSFANRIKLDFHNGITGIVGPNGSGKSNVADAVRWVLGEQRARQLRGGSMQDVIFSGTELRKPLGFAYVSITLDNSDHALSIDFEEVTVSRRLYRSGESEYMINNSPCRLKDINELFYDTGIGKEGYSIIGQGQIDQILSSKPEDRRNLFDEAAGIVKFKLRKETAIKKLEDEKLNLTRITDILTELEKQLEPLEKQSEVAKIYLKNKERLKTLDVNIFLMDNERLKGLLEDASEKLSIAEKDLEEVGTRYDQARIDYDQAQARLDEIEKEIEEARNEMTSSSVLKEKLEGQLALLKEQIRSVTAGSEHFKVRKSEIEAEIAKAREEKEKVLTTKNGVDEEVSSLEAKKKAASDRYNEIQDREQLLTRQIEENNTKIINTINERANIKSRQSSLSTMKEQISIRKAELTSRLVQASSDEDKKEARMKELRDTFEAVNEEIRVLTDEQKQGEDRLAKIKEILTGSDEKIRQARTLAMQQKSKLDALANLTERYEGYGGAVKRVMEQKDNTPGVIGVVADIIKTDKKYETAIETALGGSIQNVVTKDEPTAKKMISYLKDTKGGRATFLPLTALKNQQDFRNKDALSEKGAIGLADGLVRIDDEYRAVAVNLLGRVLVVDNMDNATTIARKYGYSIRMVTLEGELLMPGGAISGGAFKNSSNLLGRRREMEDLEKDVNAKLEEASKLEEEVAAVREERNALRASLETTRLKLQNKFIEQNTARLNVVREEEKQKEEATSFESLKTESLDIENQVADIERQESETRQKLDESIQTEKDCQKAVEDLGRELSELSETEEEAASEVSRWEMEIAKVSQRLEFQQENLSRIDEEIITRQKDLDEVLEHIESSESELEHKNAEIVEIGKTMEASATSSKENKEKLEKIQHTREEISSKQKNFFEVREKLAESKSSLDREVNRLTSQKEKLDSQIEGLINYMWDEYEITLSQASLMKDPELNDATAMKKEIGQLKNAIRELGDVNVNAIEDYKNVSERYTFLRTQHDDLVVAEEQLRVIIADLDESMRNQFREQFKLISEQFDKVFKEMFGGGHGTLEIDDSVDILEAGIKIIAQPPGKKLVNMNMMSGGEKALTAIALLFAIQNLKPSPFCLLDEIEAALDENNVVRFAKYLHKLKDTQFIVITHRRGTMESADRLYGITMQEKGVSALVSVNLIDKELTN
ncbi:chromosome segregation protein SMC [Butyrivibrio fibrisolvens]|uniref:Chromosome partition protein Smc n=1 Tax=Butyrivibrio fibrisolvens TaxID=831 RepID=A0A317G3G2_BUTFI|nr:chromosome segregation protein SMC [Butyrivibrio fibrisolvens]PWT28508.1 chromosome segregation protein SMC [Butyrivibrio fibrisolvens]